MNKAARFVLSVFLLLPALLFCRGCSSGASMSPAPGETRLVIFHSNDVHGKIDNFAKVAAILKRERESGADVFYFCAGDNFTGNPIVDRFNPPGEPMLQLLNRLGLDLLAVGNHEFDYGLAVLENFAARARFPLLAANIQAPPGAFPQLRPSVVLEASGGIKIAVFGLIQIEKASGLPSTLPERVKGLTFSEPLQAALEMKTMRPGNHVLIALTHIGYDQDRLLAERMPELDVIIGGHSHTRVDPAEIVNGVLIAQTGSDNRFLGRVELRMRDGRVIEKKGRLIDLRGKLKEDPEVKAMIDRFNRNPALTRVLATAPFDITGKEELGCLMTDAWRRELGLDIAFQNNGGIRLNRLDKKITLKDVYALDPFDNQVVEITMTAAEIRGLVRESFERGDDIDLQVSGITYTVRTDKDQSVKEVLLRGAGGKALPEDRTFTVGFSSFIPSAYRFEHKDPGRSLGISTADVLIHFLERHPDLSVYRDIRRAFVETEGQS
ncbi:MAG: bifunctional UDP-sugar hydrolase/5'-nucleotidase [Candidatus Aminicenantes bacterium]|nr:bifunctional UDP-sugar hydrolase/5'-nucleotidase [Candidatus Aminicenantes bacterium]